MIIWGYAAVPVPGVSGFRISASPHHRLGLQKEDEDYGNTEIAGSRDGFGALCHAAFDES